jgi:hypothetical protein
MNASQEKALFHLTGQSDLSKIQESTLKQMVAEFPYFAPVHLFMAEKCQATDVHQYETASQKANLYFTNPYWLHYQLNSHTANPEMADASISLETIIHQSNQSNFTGLQREKVKELPDASFQEQASEDPLLLDEAKTSSPEIPVSQDQASHHISNDFSIPTIERVKEMMRGIDKQPMIENTNILPEGVEVNQPDFIEPRVTLSQNESEFVEPVPSLSQNESVLIEPLASLSQNDPEVDDTEETELEEDMTISESYDEKIATAESNAKISSLLSGQLADFKKPVTDADQLGLPKDPMHTIDYFASQGIKIDLSQIPQDKLTTHLRRFTDWLKYMKSENPNPVDLGTRKDLEEAVELIAHSSNESKEVLTESMADVLQKQGQIDKAIQLYIKLSFLNPEKSAYFAAKIQHLKGIQ